MNVESRYSPSVEAALRNNPQFSHLKKTNSDQPYIPHVSSPEARELLYIDPFTDITPPKPTVLPGYERNDYSYKELAEVTKEFLHDQEVAQRIHVGASSMWAAQLRHAQGPGALEAALTRIDAIEERARRYRHATGLAQWVRKRGVQTEWVQSPIPKEMIERIDRVAVTRGEKRAVTMRVLIEFGLILIDERARRYEAWMLQRLREAAQQRAEQSDNPVQAVAQVFAEVEPERYFDKERPGFERAHTMVDPLHGAPPTVRAVLQRAGDAPRRLSA